MQLGGTSFFESKQRQNEDRTDLWVTLSLIVVLIAWLIWFVAMPLPQTMVSQTAVLSTDRTLTATFSPELLVHFESGQTGELILDDFPRETYGSIPVTIRQVDRAVRDGQILVEFRIDLENAPDLPYQRNLAGAVQIVIDHQTAAELIWQTIKRNNR